MFVETKGGFGLVVERHFVIFFPLYLSALFYMLSEEGICDYCVGLGSAQAFIIRRCVL